jgi:hypothetical protein
MFTHTIAHVLYKATGDAQYKAEEPDLRNEQMIIKKAEPDRF